MRVAYICSDLGVPVFGWKGCSIHVQEVVRALRGQGASIELFATRFDGEPPPDLKGIVIHRIPAPPKGELAARERGAIAVNGDLRAALEREGPFDMVYERYSLWSFAGMEYARSAKVPGVLEVNAPLIEEQAEHRGLVNREAAARMAEDVFEAATALLAVSRNVAAYLESHPVARGRVHVVPNGVSPERFPENLRPSCPGRPGTFTVGFVGTLKPWHGLPILIGAFALLHRHNPDTRLLIVGDGTVRERLAADLSAHELLDAVHLTGAVTPEEVPGLLASMDVAVAPYPQLPNFYFSPMKVYEYMAAGLPVVASRIGQLEELIQDGVNGVLCPPGDAAALMTALDSLRRNAGLRARLGRAARECVLRKHTWEQVARRILDLAELKMIHAETHGCAVR